MVKHKDKIKSNELDQPTIQIGSHLTVYTYPDGRTELKWDDEALARDVREALEAYELKKLKPNVLAKVLNRKKKRNI
jgi:hypothetical protein